MQVKACPFASFLDDQEIHPEIPMEKRDGEFRLRNSQSISRSSNSEAKHMSNEDVSEEHEIHWDSGIMEG